MTTIKVEVEIECDSCATNLVELSRWWCGICETYAPPTMPGYNNTMHPQRRIIELEKAVDELRVKIAEIETPPDWGA